MAITFLNLIHRDDEQDIILVFQQPRKVDATSESGWPAAPADILSISIWLLLGGGRKEEGSRGFGGKSPSSITCH